MTPSLDTLLHAVGDPRRRAVFEQVSRSHGISVSDLTAGSGITQGAISQHLKVLKEAGLVVGEPKGRHVFYRAKPGALAPLVHWLGHYELFWRDRMSDLRALLEEIDG